MIKIVVDDLIFGFLCNVFVFVIVICGVWSGDVDKGLKDFDRLDWIDCFNFCNCINDVDLIGDWFGWDNYNWDGKDGWNNNGFWWCGD